jgi:hypothetical protein
MKTIERSLSCLRTAAKITCCGFAAQATLILACLGGCAHVPVSGSTDPGIVESGSIGLSRPVPHVASLTSHQPLLGFLPTKHTQSAPRLELHRHPEKAVLITRSGERRELQAVGIEQLQAGVYSVTLKQQSPLWYAPASYFENRGLETPAEGNKERFRRGALGEYTVFLNDQTPLHCGPVDSPDIGGVQLAESDLKGLFDAAEVGMTVQVF